MRLPTSPPDGDQQRRPEAHSLYSFRGREFPVDDNGHQRARSRAHVSDFGGAERGARGLEAAGPYFPFEGAGRGREGAGGPYGGCGGVLQAGGEEACSCYCGDGG